jgi:hypothetical protein
MQHTIEITAFPVILRALKGYRNRLEAYYPGTDVPRPVRVEKIAVLSVIEEMEGAA